MGAQEKAENLDQDDQYGRQGEGCKKGGSPCHSQGIILPELFKRFAKQGENIYPFTGSRHQQFLIEQ